MASFAGKAQMGGLFDTFFTYQGVFDPGDAATGSGTFASSDVTVPGVALGDIVLGSSFSLDTVDTAIVAAVTAANTVTVTVLNNTAGAVNLASGTLNLFIGRPSNTYFRT